MAAWPYWTPFLLCALFSFVRAKPGKAEIFAIALSLILWIGLRHEVGADWDTYLSWLDEVRGVDLITALHYYDPAYALLNWLGANGFGGIYLVNIVCATFAVVPLVLFCRRQSNFALALLVAAPYLISVVYMGYTRQSAAIGLGIVAMASIRRQAVWQFVLAVTAAALFHKTAVCLFVLAPALLVEKHDRAALGRFAAVMLCALVVSGLIMWSEAAELTGRYILTTGDNLLSAGVPLMRPEPQIASSPGALYSTGAVARLFQSVVAALALTVLIRHTRIARTEIGLWTIAAVAVIVLFVLAFWRSTIADRIGLFFIPLQIYVFSNLPAAYKPPFSHIAKGVIIACCGAAFFVWLSYGDNVAAWMPYQSLLSAGMR